MRIIISIVACLSCALQSVAQQPVEKLISTEKKFANTSKEQSTKKAFLSFVDSNCIGFNNGEQLNVFKEWTGRKEDSSKLTWQPNFAIIASSGELGVTAGPWEYRPTSLQDTPVAHGNFTTVWKKKSNGEWKAIMDMGTSYQENIENNPSIKIIVLNNKNSVDNAEAMQADKSFAALFKNDPAKAIEDVIEKESWVSINGFAPYKGVENIKNAISKMPAGTEFTPIGSFMSTNADLYVVYGTVIMNNKKQSYMRVWKRDNKNWKLIAMVLS